MAEDRAPGNLSGSRLQIAGSAAMDTDGVLLRAAHDFVRTTAEGVVASGGGLVVGVGGEPIGEAGMACIFDWTVLEVIAALPDPAVGWASQVEPRFCLVGSQAGVRNVPAWRQELWTRCVGRTDVTLIQSQPGWRMGVVIRENQAERADLLLAIGGGAGIEQLAEIYVRAGKRVIPVWSDLGALSGDGNGGARRLHESALARPGELFALRQGRGDTTARLHPLRLEPGTDPHQLAEGTLGILSDLRPPLASFVRLLDERDPEFPSVEAFFREVVDDAVVALGFSGHEVGRDDSLAAFLNVEIFMALNRAQLVVVDLTGVRPNCLMELGYALALRRRVVISAKQGTRLPFDADKLRTFFWEDPPPADAIDRYVDWSRQYMSVPPIVPVQ